MTNFLASLKKIPRWLFPYRWIGLVIIIVWIAFLLRLQNMNENASQQNLKELFPWAIKIKPKTGSSWMGIYIKNKKIGYFNTIIQKERAGYTITQRSLMFLKLIGPKQKIRLVSTIHVDAHFHFKNFSFRLHTPLSQFAASGWTHGPKLHISLRIGKMNKKLTIKYRPSLLTPVLYPYLASLKPKPHTKLKTILFNPQTLSYKPAFIEIIGYEKLTIHGKSYEALKLKQLAHGTPIWTWIDSEGQTLKELAPSGITLLRESPQQATQHIHDDVNLLLASRIIPQGNIPHPKTQKHLTLKLSNITLDQFPALNQGRQRLQKYLLLIRKESLSSLPQTPLNSALPPLPALQKALKSTPLIQSNAPQIQNKARQITQNASSRLHALKKLLLWTYQSIKKQNVVGIPSALETLNKKIGDCNEHSTLLAALARSINIPCRIISGLAYLDGAFFFHSWNECYLGQHQKRPFWLSVDPTWNQIPADITHIAFVRGDLSKQLALIQLLGQLHITILPNRRP